MVAKEAVVMEILIAIAVVAYFLIREKFREYKADKYADQMMEMRNKKKKT